MSLLLKRLVFLSLVLLAGRNSIQAEPPTKYAPFHLPFIKVMAGPRVITIQEDKANYANPSFTGSFMRTAQSSSSSRRSNLIRYSTTSNPFQGSLEGELIFDPRSSADYEPASRDSRLLAGGVNWVTVSNDGYPLASNYWRGFYRFDSIFVSHQLPVGEFTVRFDSLDSFPPGSRFFLRDKKALQGRDTIIDLLINPSYTFRHDEPGFYRGVDRFCIFAIPPALAVDQPMPQAKGSLVLWPNPARAQVSVFCPQAGLLILRDAQGRLVRRQTAAAGRKLTVDIAGVPRGIYLVTLGKHTQRLVVE